MSGGMRVPVPSQEVLARRAALADRPGEHLWTMLAAWVVDPALTAAPAASVPLDAENLVLLTGPGCYKCEQPYSRSLARRRCTGSVEDSQ